ncbi:uncharacterized protein BDZ99DRAFT_309474 [Mytilinidion resinicola]|uniref:Uncharacterized protein n=1 Tax=Mytilinidion resinicola TaxID=574789 RepID=A0A6A6YR22_9PEZI|nr:uncharacterized protein BDZ99DRAFT_309474 [Mytilinidion resinicola]KAF2810327.1 hypothetical protein BDZ99DRAFT_309474 [Mytilinidion resinicola]
MRNLWQVPQRTTLTPPLFSNMITALVERKSPSRVGKRTRAGSKFQDEKIRDTIGYITHFLSERQGPQKGKTTNEINANQPAPFPDPIRISPKKEYPPSRPTQTPPLVNTNAPNT